MVVFGWRADVNVVSVEKRGLVEKLGFLGFDFAVREAFSRVSSFRQRRVVSPDGVAVQLLSLIINQGVRIDLNSIRKS